ncbi:MAG: UDP-2,3-diacylglucosamine diphosphatase [Leptothrix sp. (in: b-proteobacteria)]
MSADDLTSPQPAGPSSVGPVWTLDPAWQAVDFVSDLHLADDTPQTLARFTAYLQHTTADAVLLLGDVFEAWVGDDCLGERDSFEAQLAAELMQVARQRCVSFMVGNRDFLFGAAACEQIGLKPLADPMTLQAWSQRTLLSHGDAWCLDDAPYQAFRAQVRSAAWHQAVLARPLAERRALARQMRSASDGRKQEHGMSVYADLDAGTVERALQATDASVLVHGHTHRPADHVLASGRRRLVLSDWHTEPDGSAPRAEVLRWSASGFERLRVDEQGQLHPC